MGYDVLVCLDFEATCDNEQPPLVRRGSGEIIEFAWAALDVASGGVFHTQQSYCQPCHSQVTPFCTTLTGIDEALLRRCGGSLAEAVQTLADFCAAQARQGRRLGVVTHGAWDLEQQLPREARLKGVVMPDPLKRFINLMDVFGPACRSLDIPPQGYTLPEMCAAVGLQFDGRLHSGLADAKNIAAIVATLLKSPAVQQQWFSAPTEDLEDRRRVFRESQLHSLIITSLPRRVTQPSVVQWLISLSLPAPDVCSAVLRGGTPTRKVVFSYNDHEKAACVLDRLSWGAEFDANGTLPGEDTDCLVFAKPLLPSELESWWARLVCFPTTTDEAVTLWTVGVMTGDWFCRVCLNHNWGSLQECRQCRRPFTPLLLPEAEAPGEWVQVVSGSGETFGRLGCVQHTSDKFFLLKEGSVWAKADTRRVALPAGFVTAEVRECEESSDEGDNEEEEDDDDEEEEWDEEEEEAAEGLESGLDPLGSTSLDIPAAPNGMAGKGNASHDTLITTLEGGCNASGTAAPQTRL
eukprot:GGOE01003988.1.p1 GENE.GGOE01003988.1~~GGOE01003988.1.p1  ORF type:complete len:521 (-),score=156.42 GGOE01003988.1:85-1647(-)